MAERTPGPWKVGAKQQKLNWIEITVEGDPDDSGLCSASPVAVCYGTTSTLVDTMAGACHVHANAHVIAAAPELLAALKALVKATIEADNIYDLGLHGGEAVMEHALAAIAKAEGRSE